MRKILFVCYGGGHVRMVLPVVRELQRRGGFQPLILALTSARADVLGAGLPCLGFADFVEADDADAIRRGEVLAAGLDSHTADPRESAAYLGLSWADLARDKGDAQADALYAQHGRHVFLPVDTMERIIRRVGPIAVVATSAPRAERAAILAARRCGVPALCMVDLFAAYEVQWLQDAGYADRVCVLNEQVRDRLQAAGRASDDIVVTGNPAFDRIWDQQVLEQGAALRAQRGWQDKTVVLWASQVEPESHPSNPGRGDPALPQRVADTLRGLLPGHPQLELVMRPHPSQPAAPAAGMSREWLSPRRENLHVLLHACDVVVVLTSTVGVEARIAGKHVIQVLGSLYSSDAPYLAYGVADQAVTLEKLQQAVLAAARTKLSNASDKRPGQAAARVVDELQGLLSS